MTDLVSLAGLARSLVIYYGRPWRIAQAARFYADFVRPGDIAFDIGAHVGNRTRALTRAGAHVIAVEPQHLFSRFLAATLPRDTTILPVAVGNAPGPASMTVSRLHPTVSTIAADFGDNVGRARGFTKVTWDRMQPVEVTTLDRLVERFGVPAFIKIDVEGHEAEVLAGLSHPVSTVAFEYLPPAIGVALACIDRLALLADYEFNIVRGEGFDFLMPAWTTADGMRFWLSRRQPEEGSGDVYARRKSRQPGISGDHGALLNEWPVDRRGRRQSQ